MYKHALFLILSMGIATNSMAFKALPFMTTPNKTSVKNTTHKKQKVSTEQNVDFSGNWQGICSAGNDSFPTALLIENDCKLSLRINGQNYHIGHNTYSFTEGTSFIWEHAGFKWAEQGNKLTGNFIDILENFADSTEHYSLFTKMTLSLDNNKLIMHLSQSSLEDPEDGNESTQENFNCSLERVN